MTYLLPLNPNLNEVCSKVTSEKYLNNIAFNLKISDVLLKFKRAREGISTTKQIVITAITCAAIAFRPKKIVVRVGCIAFSAFAYNSYAKLVEKKECNLLLTMQAIKEIEYLSDPDLVKKSLASLHSYENNESLREIQSYLDDLEELPLKKEWQKKYKKISADLKKINQILMYFKTDELSRSAKLEEAQLDLLLEDLTPLINDVDKNRATLKEIQKTLEFLKESSFVKPDFLNLNSKILADQENLSKKLNTLQKNSSIFKENKTPLNKLANTYLKFDQNILDKTRACRNFMFYSLAGTALIKVGLFFNKHFNKSNWADQEIMMKVIGHPFLLITLGGLSIAYAAKNVCTLIAHRNDRAEEENAYKNFTEDDISKLQLLLKQG
ncbi:MAG: hypothetical protein ACRCU0_02280 [Candidatus Rhabdochlamydia sp.]